MAKVPSKPTKEYAKKLGDKLKVDWKKVDLKQFTSGIRTEREHADVTKLDPVKTAKIALAHLKEVPDYYTKLKKVEKRGK